MTSQVPSPTPTVGQLVAERPERGRIFERLGIDYCCGGRKSLAAACAERGLDLSMVRSQLADADAAPREGGEPDWTTATLTSLADHIQAVHHGFMARELPRVGALVRKVAGVHSGSHPELTRLQEVFAEFSRELLAHMSTEETSLFPWIRALESGATQNPAPAGPLDEPVRRMMREHDDAGLALAKMRELTHGYVPPNNACGSYRVMLSGLADIEADMHLHVHKENNILFPRALALEASTRAPIGVGSCCIRHS